MQYSKNHHFLPQSYLKRFCSLNDELYILNKEYCKVNPTPKTTAQICYQKNLHTVHAYGEKSLMLENILGMFEDKFSLFIDFIEGIDEKVLNECLNNSSYVNTLKIMLSIQFWRNPQATNLALSCANDLMNIFDSAHELNKQVLSMPRKELKFIFKKRENSAMQKIIQFFLLPLLTFPLDGLLPKSFKINRRPSNSLDKFITSDNPIYSQNYNKVTSCFEGEFAFPLTENLILTNLACSNETEFNLIQTRLINNAHRYGISSTKSTLDKLVDRM